MGGIQSRGMIWQHRRTLDGFRARRYSNTQSPLRWDLTNESFPIDSDGMVRIPD